MSAPEYVGGLSWGYDPQVGPTAAEEAAEEKLADEAEWRRQQAALRATSTGTLNVERDRLDGLLSRNVGDARWTLRLSVDLAAVVAELNRRGAA